MVTIDITRLPEDNSQKDEAQLWEEFFQAGDALAESDEPGKETLTSAVLSLRR